MLASKSNREDRPSCAPASSRSTPATASRCGRRQIPPLQAAMPPGAANMGYTASVSAQAVGGVNWQRHAHQHSSPRQDPPSFGMRRAGGGSKDWGWEYIDRILPWLDLWPDPNPSVMPIAGWIRTLKRHQLKASRSTAALWCVCPIALEAMRVRGAAQCAGCKPVPCA